jgi:hypothetical protein
MRLWGVWPDSGDWPLRQRIAAMLFRQFSPAALAFILAFASVHSALAQTGKSVPHDGYFGGFGLYYDGQFSDARKYFRDAAHGGFASTEGRWVDSICFHTMIG